jgi:long-chain acyl-CoA synthetase
MDVATTALLKALTEVRTLAQLFNWRVAATPLAEAYRWHDTQAGQWRSVSWQMAGQQVRRYALSLARMALPRGARVAILLPNGLPNVYMDQATLALAHVPVPMHALDNPASIAYILRDSDASLVVTTSMAQWQAIAAVGEALPALRRVVVLEVDGTPGPAPGNVPVTSLAQWLADAEVAGAFPMPQSPEHDDLAALVYTSGTTGKPKGVMLTHDNVVSNIKAVLQHIAPVADDVFLSFLPLSHTFERTGGYYLPVAAGCCVAFARSTALLAEDLKTVKPTILISVPRIYERVYAAVQSRLAGKRLQSLLFHAAQEVGWRRFSRTQKLVPPVGGSALLDALAWPLLDQLVAKPFRAQLGGRLRLAVSGGAPLALPIARCFLGLGLPIAQGYGMTESSPVVCANTFDDNHPETVGRALNGVEVRVDPQTKELLVRGPNVMRGYWKREEDTAQALADGWLHTGDQASIEQGRIRILGRIKEIIVTSTGEKIAPADLELSIATDPLFEQVYAFGDNRPFIGCIVVLNQNAWRRLAGELQLDADRAASLDAPLARETALSRLRGLTHAFPHYAQPRAVRLTLEPWTVENSLMTPTLKLKRKNLAAHFAAQIEDMYRKR